MNYLEISRQAILNYYIPEQAPGEKGRKDKQFICLSSFLSSVFHFVRIGPMLLLSSVALTLWVAMGWGGGQGFSDCSATREKLEWSPPFQSVLCILPVILREPGHFSLRIPGRIKHIFAACMADWDSTHCGMNTSNGPVFHRH